MCTARLCRLFGSRTFFSGLGLNDEFIRVYFGRWKQTRRKKIKQPRVVYQSTWVFRREFDTEIGYDDEDDVVLTRHNVKTIIIISKINIHRYCAGENRRPLFISIKTSWRAGLWTTIGLLDYSALFRNTYIFHRRRVANIKKKRQ